MKTDDFDPDAVAASRFFGAVLGFVFGGVGVSVIFFLWSQPFGKFDSPPLFFRIFGSLIAIPFVMIGGATGFAAVKGRHWFSRSYRLPKEGPSVPNAATASPSSGNYSCSSCGAPLDSKAEVSPHGDVKCGHCDRWFNIHGRS